MCPIMLRRAAEENNYSVKLTWLSDHITLLNLKKGKEKKMWYLHVEPVYYQATRHGILLPGSFDCRK